MIKTEGGCTCACTYSLFCIGPLSGEKPAVKRETRVMQIPLWAGNQLGEAGRSTAHTPPDPAAHPLPGRLSPHPPDPSHHARCRESPVHPGTGTRMEVPDPPAAPHTQGRLVLPASVLGGRGAAVLTKLLMTATGLYYKHLSLI